MAQEVDSATRARAAAEEAAADAARREAQSADAAVSSATAASTSCIAEVKSLRHELDQAVEARNCAQSMLSAINDRCFELMQQCRHLAQLQHDAEARAQAAHSQLANVTREFDSRFEATTLDLEQEATRACEEEAARCKLELRVHDLEQRLSSAQAAADIAQQQLAQQSRHQLDLEKLQGKAAKQAAELRLARDEVQPLAYFHIIPAFVIPSLLQITALRSRSSNFDEEIMALRRQMLKVSLSTWLCFCGSAIASADSAESPPSHTFQVGGRPFGCS